YLQVKENIMQIKSNDYWVWYTEDNKKSNNDNIGKWMYFFSDYQFVSEICKKAIANKVVEICKHTSNEETGVACFYLNRDDNKGHRRVIKFFLDNNLIKRTKSGKLTNI